MRKNNSSSILVLFFMLLFFLQNGITAQTLKLKIIETSDVHGAIFPFDLKNNKPASTSLAQVMSYVSQERNKKNQETILLDDGDILQGQPVVYYYNFEKTNVPHVLSQIMNFMKYDAATVGNHDIEAGHPVYDRINKEFQFPWLAANAIDRKTGKPYFKPYVILTKKGVKIAVLGLITPAIPNWLPEKIWAGIEFEDMIQSAAKWVKEINEKEHPDVLIGLFHSGVEWDYNNQTADMPKNENASMLVARQVTGFDAIFTGHDHKVWVLNEKNPEGGSVVVLGPTNDARTVASLNINMKMDPNTHKWEKQIQGENVEIKNFKPDSLFMKNFTPQMNEVKDYVSKKIGTFTKTISTRESIFGNSAFMDIIQNIQLDLTGADVSFAAPLSFDTKIEKGDVYVRDMFKLYKFENLLYTMELTGQEIKDILEFSSSLWFNVMKNSDDHLLNFKKDATGSLVFNDRDKSPQLAAQYYNFESAAGINYTIDVSKPAGERVAIISMANGKPFDLNKKYKAAVNSYRGNGGGGHLTEGAKIPKEELPKRIINSTEKDLRFFLMKWIEKTGTITPSANGNWKIIPQEWWLKGKEKDFKLLYDQAKTTE